MWDFKTDPEFQRKLDWIAHFVREKVEPLDALWPSKVYERPMRADVAALVAPLQFEVRSQGLWACHLRPELGGQGYGQVKLALMNEVLGHSAWGPTVFGIQAPDTGNAEILAHFGTLEQKRRYLQPLLGGEIVSTFSMTEPQGGADPRVFTTRAVRDGDEWVLNGTKFFSSNARWASFLIVMAVTDPDVDVHDGASMFIVPTGVPGMSIERNLGSHGEALGEGSHAVVRYKDVRLPIDALLGEEGQGFHVAQARLGGGRIHHAMRTVGLARFALDMMVERAVSRRTHDGLLGDKQAVQFSIADSYVDIIQFRLFVLYVAWRIDRLQDYHAVRHEIAAIKATTPRVLHDVVQRAMQVHGALGVSNEMPLAAMWQQAAVLGLVDGPTEVHKATVARALMKSASPAVGMWPSAWLPGRKERARAVFENQAGSTPMDKL